jgi:hypothetical protein
MIIPLRYGPSAASLPERRRPKAIATWRSKKVRWRPRLQIVCWWLTAAGWCLSALCIVLSEHKEFSADTQFLLGVLGMSTLILDLLATSVLLSSLEPVRIPYLGAPGQAEPPEPQPHPRLYVVRRDGGRLRVPRP